MVKLAYNRFRPATLVSYHQQSVTIYSNLGITPAAFSGDISVAAEYKKQALTAELNALKKKIAELIKDVSGLSALQELADAQQPYDEGKYLTLFKKAKELHPALNEKIQKKNKLLNQLENFSKATFVRNDERSIYDEKNEPFSILKFDGNSAAENMDNTQTLVRVRKDVIEYLTKTEESVYHPSDLTKKDFSSEFAFNELLDQ